MTYVRLLIIVLTIAKELVEFLNDRYDDRKKAAEKAKTLKQKIREARKNGNTKEIESAFSDIDSV